MTEAIWLEVKGTDISIVFVYVWGKIKIGHPDADS